MSVTRPQQAVRAPAAFGRPRLQHPRVIAAAGVLGLALLAAVLAGIWAGRHAAPAESPPPDQVRQVSAGHGRLTVPATWRPATLSATGLPGLTPAKSAALSVRTDVPAWAVAMITPADHASLVTHPLRRLLQGPLPPPRETRLGGRVAWLYTGLTTRAGRALELTVQPTTAGVLAVACVSPASARPPEALCGGAVTVGGRQRGHDARARAFGRTGARAGATAPGARRHSDEDAREPEPRGVPRGAGTAGATPGGRASRRGGSAGAAGRDGRCLARPRAPEGRERLRGPGHSGGRRITRRVLGCSAGHRRGRVAPRGRRRVREPPHRAEARPIAPARRLHAPFRPVVAVALARRRQPGRRPRARPRAASVGPAQGSTRRLRAARAGTSEPP